MKKIILVCAAALTIFAADAQVKKGVKRSKKPNKEAIAKARYTKQEAEKSLARRAQLDSLMSTDSLRKAGDSLADVQKENDRIVYKQNGLKTIDSINKETYAALMKQRNNTDKNQKLSEDLTKEANLSLYESTQVDYINQQYNEKAKALLQGSDPSLKKTELVVLNDERRSKIKAVVGKGKERRLEKDRKNYIQKNGATEDSQWVDIAESVTKQ